MWLSAVALIASLTAIDGVVRRIGHFVEQPYDSDFRLNYVAAKIGLTYGWSHIYDLGLEQQVMAKVTPYANGINTMHNYVTPPLLAWIHVPFTFLAVPAGFVAWVIFTTAALIAAWWLVCPGTGLARVTILVIAFALWPMYYAFTIGQTVMLTIACLAACWWFLERERWAAAGTALAVGLFIKPQLILLLPLALLVSGHWRPVVYFAAASAALAVVSVVMLGPHGIATYESSVSYTSTDSRHGILTFAWFGRGVVATSIEVTLGVVAVALAWYRRERMDIVFALGIVGSTASAFYLHEYDVPVFLLPAWILLRRHLSVPQRAWIALGIVCAQLVGIGFIRPILLWEAGWIVLLGCEPWLLVRAPNMSAAGLRLPFGERPVAVSQRPARP
ncbi:MAG TPA: glycosyltransferase family 87 protein [Candidatus Dormibacteraeota bacterium]|nr:glycosyltransferase family 87 protein [Candidatus Dormibacteraeota bacterium]